LEDLGLSTAEAKIYIALLESGTSKTGKIIDKTKLQSSTVYHVLGSLIEKGIVSSVYKGKIKYYQAENPESLMAFLNEKKRKLSDILPELKEKERLNKQRQTAKVYEGIKGITAAFNDILETMKKGEEYYFFQFQYEQMKRPEIILFFQNYHRKRSERGIKVRGIASPKTRELNQHIYNLPHTQIRYIENPAPTVVVIYKNKILLLDWDETPVAITIQSETIYNSHKKFFEEKWKAAR